MITIITENQCFVVCTVVSDLSLMLVARFDYCNLVWNNYLSNVSAELLANVSVLKNFLLYRDKPELCSYMKLVQYY